MARCVGIPAQDTSKLSVRRERLTPQSWHSEKLCFQAAVLLVLQKRPIMTA